MFAVFFAVSFQEQTAEQTADLSPRDAHMTSP